MDKKKKCVDPSIKECSNCGTSGAKLTCSKCKSATYCSKACQKQHWVNGHKGACIAPEKRRPHAQKPDAAMAADKQGEESCEECPICLEVLLDATLCTLPCEHKFHQECVEALRKLGVLQACPLCRAELPDSPNKIFAEAVQKYVLVARKVESGKTSWQTLAASEQKIVTEAMAMWTTAAKQGHAAAQYNLGLMYSKGEGVSLDLAEAVRWTRKAAEQGDANAQCNLGLMY